MGAGSVPSYHVGSIAEMHLLMIPCLVSLALQDAGRLVQLCHSALPIAALRYDLATLCKWRDNPPEGSIYLSLWVTPFLSSYINACDPATDILGWGREQIPVRR